MTKREFDKHPTSGVVNDQNISFAGRAMYRTCRMKGDSDSPDLMAERRYLIPIAHTKYSMTRWSREADDLAVRRLYGIGGWSFLSPAYHMTSHRYRLRFILDMRLGRTDRYIGDSGFAAWSKEVSRRWRNTSWWHTGTHRNGKYEEAKRYQRSISVFSEAGRQ